MLSFVKLSNICCKISILLIWLIHVISFILISITIDDEGKKSLVRLSGGDMRKALNILQVLLLNNIFLSFKNAHYSIQCCVNLLLFIYYYYLLFVLFCYDVARAPH